MKCWKCGQELTDGTSVCAYCGAAQSWIAPVTEAGRVMRLLYDRYGAQVVLTNGAYLTNGLGDVMEDSKKLRNQLRMAMDAGVGRLYLEQLSYGAPNGDFDRRVRALLTEDAGLNDKAAEELAGYFDEMIGWRAVSQPKPPTYTPPSSPRERPLGPDETNHGGYDTVSEPEINRSSTQEMERTVQGKGSTRDKLYPYEWVALGSAPLSLLLILAFILVAILEGILKSVSGFESIVEQTANVLDKRFEVFFVLPLAVSLFVLPIVSLLMSFSMKKENLKPIGSKSVRRKISFLTGSLSFFSVMFVVTGVVLLFQLIAHLLHIEDHTGEIADLIGVAITFFVFFVIYGSLLSQMRRHRDLEGE